MWVSLSELCFRDFLFKFFDVKLLLLRIGILVSHHLIVKLLVCSLLFVVFLWGDRLISGGSFHHGQVSGHWSDSVSEVNQIESQICEGGHLRIELSLGNRKEAALRAADGKVFEAFHKSDAISVGQVVEVFEEALLFLVRLVVVAVLLDSFSSHILSVWARLFSTYLVRVFMVKHDLTKGSALPVSVVPVKQVSMDGWITVFHSFSPSLLLSLSSSKMLDYSIRVHSVLVLE